MSLCLHKYVLGLLKFYVYTEWQPNKQLFWNTPQTQTKEAWSKSIHLRSALKVKVTYLTLVVYESPHLVWMEQLISCRAHGACHYLSDYPVLADTAGNSTRLGYNPALK